MVLALLCCPFSYSYANDTVFVSGGLQHDGLLDWSPVKYHSNSYLDLSVHWQAERKTFRELRATTRLELTQWPLLGYESDFGGHGVGHLSLEAAFTWGEITIGDVYGQFGSGLILDLYEEDFNTIDARASMLFRALPSQLSSNAFRFQVTTPLPDERYSQTTELVSEMQDSRVINRK